MIRDAAEDDAKAIHALFIAQAARTPLTPPDAPVHGWRVRDVGGVISGALSYFVGTRFFVTQLWVTDGFAGYRAAVELSHDAEKLAEQAGRRILFEITEGNERYTRAVESAGYHRVSSSYEKRVS